jgi:hypothetical protein
MKTHILRQGIYALMLVFASCYSCKKDEPKPEDALPPATQTGANTFGCLIDGKPWIPNGGGWFSLIDPIYAYYSIPIDSRADKKDKYNIYIGLYSNRQDIGTNMEIYVTNVFQKGKYDLASNIDLRDNYPESYAYYEVESMYPNQERFYITTSQVIGHVNFTVADTITSKFAGTFEFDAIDKNSGKIIKITNGRFDIDPATLNK